MLFLDLISKSFVFQFFRMTTPQKFDPVLKLSYIIPKVWLRSLQMIEFTKAFPRKGLSHLRKTIFSFQAYAET